MEFRIVIPARYDAERLPGKPLLEIAKKPMIQHVYERALESGAESVVIATDDKRIQEAAEKFGAQVCMTSSDHKTGTDRVAEACIALDYDEDEIVVGVPCDLPEIQPDIIRQVAADLDEHDNVKVSSICEPIRSPEQVFDPTVVKVVVNHRNYAVYFSRAPIPWDRDTFNFKDYSKIELDSTHFRHIGVYAYRASFLSDYVEWADSPIENIERLEQLRTIWNGGRIHMCIAKKRMPVGVATKEELERVRAELKK